MTDLWSADDEAPVIEYRSYWLRTDDGRSGRFWLINDPSLTPGARIRLVKNPHIWIVETLSDVVVLKPPPGVRFIVKEFVTAS